MLTSEAIKTIEIIKNKSIGYKLSGLIGGGYLIVVSKYQLTDSIKIKIRRNNIIWLKRKTFIIPKDNYSIYNSFVAICFMGFANSITDPMVQSFKKV